MIGIQRRSASDSTNGPAAAGATPPGGRGTERFEAAITGYAGRVAGPGRASRLARTVLDEAGSAASGAGAAAALTRAARAAALGELERDARGPRARAERLAALHWRCAATPGLLRERLDSEISKAGLDSLYRHLDHCDHCSGMAARCDLAEWHLEAELTATGAAGGNGAGGYRPIRAGSPAPQDLRPAQPRAAPVGGALAHWARSDIAGAGAGAPGPVAGHAAGARRLGLRGTGAPRVTRAVAAAAAAVVVAVLVAGFALVRGGGGGGRAARPGAGAAAASAGTPTGAPAAAPARSPAAAPPRSTAAVAAPPAPPAQSPPAPAVTPTHGLRTPFVVGGARYAVFRDPKQGWTGFLGTAAGPGRRWEAVTVRVRNLGMTGFDPRVLAYRLIDSRGVAHAPDARVGTGPALAGPAHPLGPAALVETRLGFRVPGTAGAQRLSFVPTPGAPPVVVALVP